VEIKPTATKTGARGGGRVWEKRRENEAGAGEITADEIIFAHTFSERELFGRE